MTKYDELPVDLLRQLLDYSPDTGLLSWRERPVSMFEDRGGRYTAEWCCRTYNSKHAGKPAFTAVSTTGYCVGGILRRVYSAHRVSWALFHGHWVPRGQEIDHINRVRTDNSIDNLRLATKTQNNHNKTTERRLSPYIGVTWFSPTGTWVAKVTKDKVIHHIGTFHDPKEAAIARDKKALELYGEHARLNFP